MKTTLCTLLFFAAAVRGFTQAPPSPGGGALTGQFHLCVDDKAVIFLNGKPLMEGHWNKREKVRSSSEIQVRAGDRLVFQLKNVVAGRFLLFEFVSSDLRTMIEFPSRSFRLLPDPSAKDFTNSSMGFGNLPVAKKLGEGSSYLPFKSGSEPTWGATDVCALGAVITAEMIKPVTK